MKPATNASARFAAPRTILNVAGSRYVFLARAAETNSAYSAFEVFVPPNAGITGLRTRDWGPLKSIMADNVAWTLPKRGMRAVTYVRRSPQEAFLTPDGWDFFRSFHSR